MARKQMLSMAMALQTAGSIRTVDGEVPRATQRGAAPACAGYSKLTPRGDTALLYDTHERAPRDLVTPTVVLLFHL